MYYAAVKKKYTYKLFIKNNKSNKNKNSKNKVTTKEQAQYVWVACSVFDSPTWCAWLL